MKATLKQCKDALKQCDGRVALAAKALGMSFQAMYQRMGKHVELQEIAENSREEMIDIAETALKKGCLQGEGWAVCFALKCLAKDRGYVERPDNVAIAISTLMDPAVAAAMIER